MIDPEFAFYGPMGFDLGALIGNLLLAYCAVPGNGQGDEYAEWLLQQVIFLSESARVGVRNGSGKSGVGGGLYTQRGYNYDGFGRRLFVGMVWLLPSLCSSKDGSRTLHEGFGQNGGRPRGYCTMNRFASKAYHCDRIVVS